VSALLLVALVLGFVLYEFAADQRLIEGQTLSVYLWDFQDAFGWPGRAAVLGLLALLVSHITLRWPYGPQ